MFRPHEEGGVCCLKPGSKGVDSELLTLTGQNAFQKKKPKKPGNAKLAMATHAKVIHSQSPMNRRIERVCANTGGNLEGQALGLSETEIQTHLSY